MIAIGSDHGGYKLKEVLIGYFNKNNFGFTDFGCFEEESVDYPPIALKVGNMVASGQAKNGILLCSTGLGICMAANKIRGVRAADCTSVYMAEMSRRHNNANVLCLGGMILDDNTAIEIVEKFLNTDFEGGRHQRRVDLIKGIEDGTLEG